MNNWPAIINANTHTDRERHTCTFKRFESLTNDYFPLFRCVKVCKQSNEVANCTSFAPENRLSFVFPFKIYLLWIAFVLDKVLMIIDYSATPSIYTIHWRCIGIECPVFLTCKVFTSSIECVLRCTSNSKLRQHHYGHSYISIFTVFQLWVNKCMGWMSTNHLRGNHVHHISKKETVSHSVLCRTNYYYVWS